MEGVEDVNIPNKREIDRDDDMVPVDDGDMPF